MTYNPFRKANGEFAKREEAGAIAAADLAAAKAAGNAALVAEIEEVIMNDFPETPLGQRMLQDKHGHGTFYSPRRQKQAVLEKPQLTVSMNDSEDASPSVEQAFHEQLRNPGSELHGISGALRLDLEKSLDQYRKEHWELVLNQELTKSEEEHGEEGLQRMLEDEDESTDFQTHVAKALVEEWLSKQEIKEEPTSEEILEARYSNSHHAEVSNILKLIEEESYGSVKLISSGYPSDGSKSDYVEFENPAGVWKVKSKRNIVFVSLEAAGKKYDMRGEFINGNDLKARLAYAIELAQAIKEFKDTGNSNDMSFLKNRDPEDIFQL